MTLLFYDQPGLSPRLLSSAGLFGILKQRFRLLRNAVVYHDPLVIEHAMKASCALHNMILMYDGRDASLLHEWENVNWEREGPDDEVVDDEMDNAHHPSEAEAEAEVDVLATETQTHQQYQLSLPTTSLSQTQQSIGIEFNRKKSKSIHKKVFAAQFFNTMVDGHIGVAEELLQR
jgi:hypothetical protein